jgi:hypothetical protein
MTAGPYAVTVIVLGRCACPCGCDYRLDGYAPHEVTCGACLDVCEVTS